MRIKLFELVIESKAQRKKDIDFDELMKNFPSETRGSLMTKFKITFNRLMPEEDETFTSRCRRVKELLEQESLGKPRQKLNAENMVFAYDNAVADLGLEKAVIV